MAHLENERHVQKDLDQLRRWSAMGDRPERVRNASCHLSGQQKRSGCCRLKCCAVASTTSTRARQAYCGARVPVGCLEGDRSGRGETEKVQPATRDGDAHRVTIVATRIVLPHLNLDSSLLVCNDPFCGELGGNGLNLES